MTTAQCSKKKYSFPFNSFRRAGSTAVKEKRKKSRKRKIRPSKSPRRKMTFSEYTPPFLLSSSSYVKSFRDYYRLCISNELTFSARKNPLSDFFYDKNLH
ncbi:hypothetical protein PUN28_005885 [Cardiocondyla obscurior]|uniref:Uncharacterized protein n=1 Tax=Cardiocondyla obscurior TaxID=286306 RepID=A0AAW2G9S6_9HYME